MPITYDFCYRFAVLLNNVADLWQVRGQRRVAEDIYWVYPGKKKKTPLMFILNVSF